MVITDIIELVRLKINDKDIIEYSDEDVLAIVNEGMRFIRSIYMEEMPDMLLSVDSFPLLANNNAVELPNKVLKLTDVRCNGRMLHYVKLRNVEDISKSGVPELFAVTSGKILLFPVPNNDAVCTISYIAETPKYEYQDDFPYPVDFAQYVQEYAAVRLGTVNGADMSMEAQVFAQLRDKIARAINTIVPDECVVDSYY